MECNSLINCWSYHRDRFRKQHGFLCRRDGSFSGVKRERAVAIYNLTASTWSAKMLSEDKRGGAVAILANNKIYIAGGSNADGLGVSNKIEIYDNITNSWSSIY